jgi:hypothetical protein
LAGNPCLVTTRPRARSRASKLARGYLAADDPGRRSMRVRILLSAAFFCAACPLQAQIWAPPGDALPKLGGPMQTAPHAGTLHEAGQAIRQARRDGELTPIEARQLRRERRILDAIAERYAADGLTPGEAADLDFRAHVLLDQARAKRTKH